MVEGTPIELKTTKVWDWVGSLVILAAAGVLVLGMRAHVPGMRSPHWLTVTFVVTIVLLVAGALWLCCSPRGRITIADGHITQSGKHPIDLDLVDVVGWRYEQGWLICYDVAGGTTRVWALGLKRRLRRSLPIARISARQARRTLSA